MASSDFAVSFTNYYIWQAVVVIIMIAHDSIWYNYNAITD